MKVKLEVYGPLREHVPEYDRRQGLLVEVPAATRVKDLFLLLNLPKPERGMVTINRRLAKDDDELPDGASVCVLPFIGGG